MSDEAGRIAELEAELARVKRERDMLQSTVSYLVRNEELDRPMTPEELDELMNAPRGAPIRSVLAEYQARIVQARG
ncbi:MAG: hypothetical protein ACSLE1_01670 [Sphingobium sp.]